VSVDILALLKRIEGAGDGDMNTVCCPECKAPKVFEDEPPEHAPGCELKAAIDELERDAVYLASLDEFIKKMQADGHPHLNSPGVTFRIGQPMKESE
jgi:hypothetical protein